MPPTTKKPEIPRWFVPERYKELTKYSYSEWASILSNRLEVESLLQDWESGDQFQDEEWKGNAIRARISKHFAAMADLKTSLPSFGTSGSAPRLTNMFSQTAPSVNNVSIGDLSLIRCWLRREKAVALAMNALDSVLARGYVADGDVPHAEHPALLEDELEALSRSAYIGLVGVDLRLGRKHLMNAFGRWLDTVRPGQKAASDRVQPNLHRWQDEAVLPIVDLTQWARWSKWTPSDLGPSNMAKIIDPFVGGAVKLESGGGFDAKKLVRTNRRKANQWLSEDMLGKLLGMAELASTGESGNRYSPEVLTHMLWARAQFLRGGQI